MNPNKQIKRLKKELEAQKRKNARLRQQLQAYQKGRAILPSGRESSPPLQRIREKHRYAVLFSKGSFAAYWIHSLKMSGTYRSLRAFGTQLRRVRLLGTLIRGGYYILLFLQTSALFLVLSVFLFLVIIPSALLLALTLSLTMLFWGRRINDRLAKRLAGKRVYVFFPDPQTDLSEHSFFCRNAKSFAVDSDSQVLVVSPHYVLSDAFGNKRPYFMVRTESERLLLVRKYYFFLLKRRVLAPLSPHVRYVY